MPRFTFSKSEPVSIGKNYSLEEAHEAVRKQVELVEAGLTTAHRAMKLLLRTYPVLKHDVKSGNAHALSALVDYYVRETLRR